MIDFSLPDDLIALRDKVAAFINDEIVPLERDPRQGPHGPAEELRLETVQLAREAKLLSPHGPREWVRA
jgi:acyl-CoA dehydrogenase